MRDLRYFFLAGAMGCAIAFRVLPAHAGEKTLHSFGSGTDGRNPYAGLTVANGVLYGTNAGGGAHDRGAVFALDPKTGAEKVVYSFGTQGGNTDGELPVAGLIDVKGLLYGTTEDGGASGRGIVFALDPNKGKEKVLYSFCSQANCPDGAYPEASLTYVNGTLYGTTIFGGAANDGTVFAIDPKTGTERIVYSFCSQAKCADGIWPVAALIDVKGTLYGTSYGGGNTNWGTVFALDPATGAETVIYSFCINQDCTDGRAPYAGLIEMKGTLYGTTEFGGTNCLANGGCGIVFAIDPAAHTEKVLYSFCSAQNCSDGAYPQANLIAVNGKLYATTEAGGSSNWGTVFAIDPATGKEKVVYSFCGQNYADGALPYAGLIDVHGTLYGTTEYGGAYAYGAVYAVTP